MAFYNKKVSGTWSRDEVYTYTRDNGTAYAGYLFTGTFDKNTDTYTLGIQHESRPTSISFDYKYFPVINDKCLAYAKVYNADKKEIASTIEFNSSEQEEYTAQTLKFEYNKEHMQSKAKYITVFFNPVTIPLSPICIEKTVVTVVLPLEKTVSWAVFSK